MSGIAQLPFLLLATLLWPVLTAVSLLGRLVHVVCGSPRSVPPPLIERKSSKKKVAVVGGGIGGMGAAWSLARSGFEVEVFEARNDLGGNAKVHEWKGTTAGACPPAFDERRAPTRALTPRSTAPNRAEGRNVSVVTGLSVLAWPRVYFRNYARLLNSLGVETTEVRAGHGSRSAASTPHAARQVTLPFFVNDLQHGAYAHDMDSEFRTALSDDRRRWQRMIAFIRAVRRPSPRLSAPWQHPQTTARAHSSTRSSPPSRGASAALRTVRAPHCLVPGAHPLARHAVRRRALAVHGVAAEPNEPGLAAPHVRPLRRVGNLLGLGHHADPQQLLPHQQGALDRRGAQGSGGTATRTAQLDDIPAVIGPVLEDMMSPDKHPVMDTWKTDSAEVFQRMSDGITVHCRAPVTKVCAGERHNNVTSPPARRFVGTKVWCADSI
jgi:hypothetical protein